MIEEFILLIFSFLESKWSFFESLFLTNSYNIFFFLREKTAFLACLFLFALILLNESLYANTLKPFSIMRRRIDVKNAPWETALYYFLDYNNKKENVYSKFANTFFLQIIISLNLFSKLPYFSGVQQQQRLSMFPVLNLVKIIQL